jgi:hypothetical protein
MLAFHFITWTLGAQWTHAANATLIGMRVAGLDHQHRSGAAKHADKQEQNGSDR